MDAAETIRAYTLCMLVCIDDGIKQQDGRWHIIERAARLAAAEAWIPIHQLAQRTSALGFRFLAIELAPDSTRAEFTAPVLRNENYF